MFHSNELLIFQISHGADLELRSCLGYTPLHVAAHYGQVEMARILLEAGAQPDQEDLQVRIHFKSNENALTGGLVKNTFTQLIS